MVEQGDVGRTEDLVCSLEDAQPVRQLMLHRRQFFSSDTLLASVVYVDARAGCKDKDYRAAPGEVGAFEFLKQGLQVAEEARGGLVASIQRLVDEGLVS